MVLHHFKGTIHILYKLYFLICIIIYTTYFSALNSNGLSSFSSIPAGAVLWAVGAIDVVGSDDDDSNCATPSCSRTFLSAGDVRTGIRLGVFTGETGAGDGVGVGVVGAGDTLLI